MLVQMDWRTEMIPLTDVFAISGVTGSMYFGAMFTEWLLYFTFSNVELILWLFMDAIGPIYFIYWSYITLWASLVLYALPWIFIIVYA